jgi:hypothetical protein
LTISIYEMTKITAEESFRYWLDGQIQLISLINSTCVYYALPEKVPTF